MIATTAGTTTEITELERRGHRDRQARIRESRDGSSKIPDSSVISSRSSVLSVFSVVVLAVVAGLLG
jgi:hypothetical protein